MTPIQERFLYFIHEREQVRMNRELLGLPRPWTKDKILAQHRFCNVNREDDAVTRWVKAHVRDPFADMGKQFLVINLLVARIFNEPSVLEWLIPLELDDVATFKKSVKARREEGKLFRGAYMMPAHGNGGKGQTTEDYWIRVIEDAMKLDFRSDTHLCEVAEKLVSIIGLGDFLANQVCTDLRYVPGYEWGDWETFVRCGPGTRRGLDRFFGRPAEGNLTQELYQAELETARDIISGDIWVSIFQYFRDPNNLSNCFCEFDKYIRASDRLAEGKPTSLRKYA